VWRKWGLAPTSAPSFILVEWRERQGFEGRRTSQLVGSPRSSSSAEALLESIQVQRSFLSRLSSPSSVSRFWLVEIPTTLPRSGWFTNHSKSFIRFSSVIYAFTYRIVELVFVLSYIRSRVWGSVEYSGTQCGDYYLIPRWLIALIRPKILDSTVNVVSEALSMHVAPPTIQIVVVPAGVTVLLGICNPPRR
jgi:hypothetical protein